MQSKNLKRSQRLGNMLDAELSRISQMNAQTQPENPGNQGPAMQGSGAAVAGPSPEQIQAQTQRIEIAKQILLLIQDSM
jgi:hypothetical protein